MKNVVIILTLLLGSFTYLTAQQREVILTKDNPPTGLVRGTYYKTPDYILKKYEGIWVYKNGDKIFKIKLKRKKFFFKQEGIYWDKLEGAYCYKSGSDCKLLDSEMSYFEIDVINLMSEELDYFLFKDVYYDKSGRATFKVLKNGKAKWTLRNSPGLRPIINGIRMEKEGFSVPMDAIFTKVK